MEISPTIKKVLKNRISMKNQTRPKIKMAAKIDAYTKWSDVKKIKIEVSLISKIISYTIVNGGSGLNIIPF